MKILEHARSMSTGDKNRIAIISAAVLTALIVGIWYLALRTPDIDASVKENSTAESLKPLFMIFKGAKEEMTEIKSDAKTYKQNSDDVKAVTQ